MSDGIYGNDFSEVLSALLEEFKVTCYQISQYSGLDQAYLSRLKNGEKQNPSPETIVKIGLALIHYCGKVQLHDIQRLFRSVGRSTTSRGALTPVIFQTHKPRDLPSLFDPIV